MPHFDPEAHLNHIAPLAPPRIASEEPEWERLGREEHERLYSEENSQDITSRIFDLLSTSLSPTIFLDFWKFDQKRVKTILESRFKDGPDDPPRWTAKFETQSRYDRSQKGPVHYGVTVTFEPAPPKPVPVPNLPKPTAQPARPTSPSATIALFGTIKAVAEAGRAAEAQAEITAANQLRQLITHCLNSPEIIDDVADQHLATLSKRYAKVKGECFIYPHTHCPALPKEAQGKPLGDIFWSTVAADMNNKVAHHGIQISFVPTDPADTTSKAHILLQPQ